MSQFYVAAQNGGSGAVTSVTGTNGVTASPTTGAVVVSGVDATTSTVGVASFNPAQFTVTTGAVSLIQNVFVGTATTTGAASSNINVNIPVPASSMVSVRANIACYDPTNNLAAAVELLGGMKNVAGTLTVISAVDVTKNTDTALNNITANLTSSGTNCLVQVTGVAAHNLDWQAIIEYIGAS